MARARTLQPERPGGGFNARPTNEDLSMRLFPKILLIATIALTSACATQSKMTHDAAPEVMQRAQLLLDRYSRNDQAGVVAMLDPGYFTLLGTNLNEKVASQSELRTFMDRDFAQWQSASFTDLRDVDVRSDGTLASAWFVVTFKAANGPSVPVRLSTTWHKVEGEWMLTQCASAIPPQ
jgi:hypothetical protein